MDHLFLLPKLSFGSDVQLLTVVLSIKVKKNSFLSLTLSLKN